METRRRGDKETRRRGDKETRRQGDKVIEGREVFLAFSPYLPISPSPHLLCLRVLVPLW